MWIYRHWVNRRFQFLNSYLLLYHILGGGLKIWGGLGIMRRMKKGKIIPNGVILEKHEYETILLFTEMGIDVELIPKSNTRGVHTPDIKMDGLKWEMKAPLGEGNQLIENTIQRALRQSQNIIVDLRHTKRHQTKCLKELKKQFMSKKNVKHLKIIMKSGRTLDLKR